MRKDRIYIRVVFKGPEAVKNHTKMLMAMQYKGIIHLDDADIEDERLSLAKAKDWTEDDVLTMNIAIDEEYVQSFTEAMRDTLPKIRFEMSNVPYEENEADKYIRKLNEERSKT